MHDPSFVDRQLPYGLIRQPNPLFELECRRLRHLRSSADLKNYSLQFLLVPVALGMFGCLCVQGERGGGIGSTLIALIVPFITVAMLIATDMYYTMITISSISHYVTSGQWDVLRITLIKDQQMLDAIYAIAQIRAWRMMLIDTAIRLGTVLLGIFVLLSVLLGQSISLSRMTASDAFVFFTFCLTLLIIILVYVTEPLWRMRALIAIGLALSARIRSLTFAAIAGFGVSLAVHIIQIVLLVGIFIGAARFNRYYVSPITSLFQVLIVVLIIAGMIFGVYKVAQILSLSDALSSAFRPE